MFQKKQCWTLVYLNNKLVNILQVKMVNLSSCNYCQHLGTRCIVKIHCSTCIDINTGYFNLQTFLAKKNVFTPFSVHLIAFSLSYLTRELSTLQCIIILATHWIKTIETHFNTKYYKNCCNIRKTIRDMRLWRRKACSFLNLNSLCPPNIEVIIIDIMFIRLVI